MNIPKILTLALAIAPPSFAADIKPGTVFQLGDKTATVTKFASLPYLQSGYTQRYHFDSSDNPKLSLLKQRYQLEKIVAPGSDEFDQQVHLMDWVHHRFKKFGRPSTPARGALEVLEAIDNGHSFFCTQYAQVLISTAASLGWVDRPLALRRHQGVNKVGGSTEHTTTEIWSNQFRKWVMLDPTSNMFLEKSGVPLSAWEIRQEWFYHDGKDLVFVVGKDRKKFRKPDLPIYLATFAGFGDLTVEPDELDKYGFIGYVPNTDVMDSGYDYGKMFITKDELCDGTQWHTRKNPEHPATDPYFPIGQSALTLSVENTKLTVSVETLTPNFDHFESRTNDGEWQPCAAQFVWETHPGSNRLEIRTVNAFGVPGPVSTAVVEVKE